MVVRAHLGDPEVDDHDIQERRLGQVHAHVAVVFADVELQPIGAGRLEKVESIATEKNPRGFNIDPTGRYLYAVGQETHHMTSYAIDQSSGRLKELKRYPVGTGPNWVEIHRLP